MSNDRDKPCIYYYSDAYKVMSHIFNTIISIKNDPFNHLKPEFTIVISNKPQIAVAMLDLQWMKMT